MIRRSLLHATAVASAIALTTYAAFAQTAPSAPLDAEKMLPAGRTLAFVSIADLSQAEAAFQTTDLGTVWRQLEPFRKELEKGLDFSMTDMKKQFEEQMGVKLEDAIRALKGGIAVGVVDMAIPEATKPAPQFVLVLAKEHKPVVERFVRKMTGADAPPEQRPPGPPPFTVMEHMNAVLVVTDAGALAQPGAKTLADEPQFQSLRAKMIGPGGAPVMLAYGNVEALLGRLAKGDPKAAEQLKKAGAMDCKAFGMSLGFADGRLRESIAIAAPGERNGFSKVLSSGKPLDPMTVATTAPGDVLSFTAMRLDARAMLDGILGVVRTLDPSAAKDMEEGLAELENRLQMRIREDLLAALGDLVTMESSVPEDGLFPETVMTVTVKDPAKLEAAFGKLGKLAGLNVKTVDRGGKQIKYLQAPLGKVGDDPTQSMSEEQLGVAFGISALMGAWVIDGGVLYTSSLPQTLEDRFERVLKGSLAGQEQFRAVVAKVPPGARSFSYGRVRPFAGGMYHVLLHALRTFEPAIRRAGVPVDTALLPRTGAVARPMLPTTGAFVADADGFQVVSQGGVPILTALPVIAAIAIPEMIKSKRMAEETAAQSALYQLKAAQEEFFAEKNQYAKSLDELLAASAMAPYMRLPPAYQFVVVSAEGAKYLIEARPRDPSKRTFVLDQTGFIRGKGEPNPFEDMPPEKPGVPEEMPREAPPGSGEGGEKE